MTASRTEILILGAGGFGRELSCYLDQLCAVDSEFAKRYGVKGFLDDNPHALDGFDYPDGVVGTIAEYQPAENERLVCALGTPATKAQVCADLLARGARFMTYIHPTALVCRTARLGDGCVLGPHAQVSADAVLDDFVFLNCHATCGHDARVGSCSTISSYCDLTGGVELGERVFMGSHASIIPGRRVGSDSVIGAGSVVVTHLSAGAHVLGVPAKPFMRGS